MNNQLFGDLPVLYPPGGMGYIIKDMVDLVPQEVNGEVCVSVGSQPNSSPHFGTVITFASAFAMAQRIKEVKGLPAKVVFDVIDTAPGSLVEVDGVKYQKPLYLETPAEGKTINDILGEYRQMMGLLSEFSGVEFEVRLLTDFSKELHFKDALMSVLEKEELFASIVNPSGGVLPVRVPCSECGLTDKHRKVTNISKKDDKFILTSYCPEHGPFEVCLNDSYDKIEMNSSLRNIIRGYIYSKYNQESEQFWCRVTGGDWSGSFQERIYLRGLYELGCDFAHIPATIYSPVITDWSGAKLSKSMYVKHGAYSELDSKFVNFDMLISKCGETEVRKVWEIVHNWMDDPLKFFRNYSVYAIEKLLEEVDT